MRFQFPMNCNDENVAKCFGLEIARLLLDSSFRDFAIARYESEKRLITQNRARDASDNVYSPLDEHKH